MSDDPREQLAEALRGYLTPEQLSKLVDGVLSDTKNVWVEFTCKDMKCGKRQRHQASIPDSLAAAKGLAELLTQGFGRPQEHKAETEIVVNRKVILVRDDDSHDQLDISG